MTLVSRECAILFADVSGSTQLYEKLGDKTAAKSIETCLNQLQTVVVQYKGRVVKTIGDEIMVVFPQPDLACEAAKAMQMKMLGMPAIEGMKLAIRIGFHFGPVLEDNDDFWGDGVNTAARIAGLAKAGQIYTSGATVEVLPARYRPLLRDLDALNVKGKLDAVRIFQLIWEESDDTTQMVGRSPIAKVEATLQLAIGGRTFEYPRDSIAVTLGRDMGCDLVVPETTASRRHARIERRGSQFYLIDESSNGTYITIEADKELLLRRDQALLRGRGKIAFGVAIDAAVHVLSYECQ